MLKPLSAVEKDPGFKYLLRETASVVLGCRKLLKPLAMKCTKRNVKSLKDKITGDFTKAIPTIAKILIAQEDIKNAKKHNVVSDLLKHNRDETIFLLNEADPHFKYTYTVKLMELTTPHPIQNPPYSISMR